MKLQIVLKDPEFDKYDSECACGLVDIWNNTARMLKECPEHKKESLAFVQGLVDSINSGTFPLLCRVHGIPLKECKDRSTCKIKTEVLKFP